jgi:hypothetical protein
LVYYYTHPTNEPIPDLENNPSFKLNIYYVFYVSMWFKYSIERIIFLFG